MEEFHQRVLGLRGNDAVAHAVKQANVDVIAAYPITPQTLMVEELSRFVAAGELKARYINTESEHSAMSGCIGASLAGARTFTATASQGLAYMHEALYAASGLRCPIVMAVACRALSAPINIHGDHSDVFGSRDSGWMQIFCENPQEAYDTTLLSFKLAEREDVLLPIMVNFDGFITSHCLERVEILPDEMVNEYLPPRKASLRLDPDNPMTFGAFALQDYYYEFKRQQHEAMIQAYRSIPEVWDDFAKLSGRRYLNVRTYKLTNADIAIVSAGSTSGTARFAVDELRQQKIRAGALGIRLFRPWPGPEVLKALRNVKAVVVLDRATSLGAPGTTLYEDIVSTLYALQKQSTITDYVYGLGGRDIRTRDIVRAVRETLKLAKEKKKVSHVKFLGVRE
ncbi:MAG: pyruvate ferredoxin oxidoreductase [Thermoproteota archaeon]